MIKNLKKILCTIFIFSLFTVNIFANEEQIIDNANLFTQDDIWEISYNINDHQPLLPFSANIFVHTTDNALGLGTEGYVADFYKNVVEPITNDAIIYLIDMDNRNTFIYVSENIRSNFNDDLLDTIIDNSYDYLKNGDYSSFIIGEIEDTIGIFDGSVDITFENGVKQEIKGFPWILLLISLIVGGIAGTVGVVSVKSKYNMDGIEYNYSPADSLHLTTNIKKDNFANKHITSRHIPKPTNNSNGSSGGSSFGSTNSSGGRGRSF